jgi:hypothetical protein
MVTLPVFLLIVFSPLVISDSDGAINLLVRSSPDSNVRRYCVELAKLPNGRTINITGFGWRTPHLASPAVNACNVTNLNDSLPGTFPPNTILVLYEHQCKMTEHAWHIESKYGPTISLMILTNRTNTHYELSYNTTAMPVSIPVLIFVQNDFNKMNKTYKGLTTVQMSINYPPIMRNKFRPTVLLMFLLVFLILLAGNFWAADEFKRKVLKRDVSTHSESTSVNIIPNPPDSQDAILSSNQEDLTAHNARKNVLLDNRTPRNNEPAILYLPYCIIALILCFAVGWLLLIYYFPKVMIYVLQGNSQTASIADITPLCSPSDACNAHENNEITTSLTCHIMIPAK